MPARHYDPETGEMEYYSGQQQLALPPASTEPRKSKLFEAPVLEAEEWFGIISHDPQYLPDCCEMTTRLRVSCNQLYANGFWDPYENKMLLFTYGEYKQHHFLPERIEAMFKKIVDQCVENLTYD